MSNFSSKHTTCSEKIVQKQIANILSKLRDLSKMKIRPFGILSNSGVSRWGGEWGVTPPAILENFVFFGRQF